MGAKIIGGKELAAALRDLPAKIQRKYARKALRVAGNIVKAQAKANINSITGCLTRSIRVKVRVSSKSSRATIGPSPKAVDKTLKAKTLPTRSTTCTRR